jgi:hypothetical protein
MMKNSLIITIVVAIVVGALGFFTGMQYQKSQRATFPQGLGQRGPSGNLGGNQRGFTGTRPVNGEITSLDDKTITIKSQDGSSKIIVYSTSTKINKTTEGSTSDLKTGEQVIVIGTENTDGTVTAQSISVGGFPRVNAQPSPANQ